MRACARMLWYLVVVVVVGICAPIMIVGLLCGLGEVAR